MPDDTVIVAASVAWSEYQSYGCYIEDTYVSRGELHPDAAVFLDAAMR